MPLARVRITGRYSHDGTSWSTTTNLTDNGGIVGGGLVPDYPLCIGVGGTTEVHSEPGEGFTVSLTIPLRTRARDESDNCSLADDQTIIRDGLTHFWRPIPHSRSCEAGNGAMPMNK